MDGSIVSGRVALFLVLDASYGLHLELSLTWQFVRNWLSLKDVAFRWCLADLPDCYRCDLKLEETCVLGCDIVI